MYTVVCVRAWNYELTSHALSICVICRRCVMFARHERLVVILKKRDYLNPLRWRDLSVDHKHLYSILNTLYSFVVYFSRRIWIWTIFALWDNFEITSASKSLNLLDCQETELLFDFKRSIEQEKFHWRVHLSNMENRIQPASMWSDVCGRCAPAISYNNV